MGPVSWALALLPLSALLASAAPDAPPSEIDVADVSNGPDACPTQDQLADALELHMPGVVARGAREPGASALRLGLALSPEGVARVTMIDAAGALRLERDLDLPKSGAGTMGVAREPRERTAACAALAETVALIVDRYMRHIGYHEPPPPALFEPGPSPQPPPVAPPPPPGGPGRIGLGLAARPPYAGASWGLEAQLMAGLRLRHVDLSALVGAALPTDEPVPMSGGKGTLRLRVFPARLSLGWTFRLGPRLALVPAVGGGVDLVLAETRGIDVVRRSSAVEPMVEAGLRVVVTMTRRVWIDLQAFQGIDLRPEQFTVTGSLNQPQVVLTTPRVYTRLGVDFGIYLGKN